MPYLVGQTIRDALSPVVRHLPGEAVPGHHLTTYRLEAMAAIVGIPDLINSPIGQANHLARTVTGLVVAVGILKKVTKV